MIDPKLQAALDAVIQEGTFSLSAVEGVKRLRDENIQFNVTVEHLENNIKGLAEDNKVLRDKERDYSERLALVATREKEVAKREAEITKLECKAAQENAVANAYKDCFGLVFRNQHVHRSLSGNVPVSGGNNYGPQTMSMNTTETESVS